MNIGKARALFNQIAAGDLKNYTVGEYLEAVKEVSNMVTFNSITKDQFVKVFRWLVMVAERVVSPYRWIPISEKLPEIDDDGYSKKVLVCFSNYSGREICEYRVIDGVGAWYVGDSDDNPEDLGVHVNAWMPLPKPYEERRTDGQNRQIH